MTAFDWSRWLAGEGEPPSIPVEATVDPQRDSDVPCPECGAPAGIGVRSAGVLVVRCMTHHLWYAVPPRGLEGPLTDSLPRGARMNPEERLWMLQAACAEMLDDRRPGTYVVVAALEHPCEYLLIRRYGERLTVEVSCREWGCPHCGDRPLPAGAVEALRAMGFHDGGHRLNPWLDRLPDDALGLAILAERALRVAYDLPADFEVVLYPGDRAARERLLARLRGPSRL